MTVAGSITEEQVARATTVLLRAAATTLPPFYLDLLENAFDKESSQGARSRLAKMLEASRYASTESRPLCQDTGVPMFLVSIGENARIRGNIHSALSQGTRTATKEIPLRENVVHPLTCQNSGTNVGWGMPHVIYDFKPGADYLEIMAVARGDGTDAATEVVKIPSTGPRLRNIRDGVLDVVYRARWACPPQVVGICIGANVTIATQVALRAVFRIPTGAGNPDPLVAQIENELFSAINSLGIGPCALGGDITALAVHVEIVGCHTISPALVVVPGCWTSGRFAVGRLYNDGSFEGITHPRFEGAVDERIQDRDTGFGKSGQEASGRRSRLH